MEKITWHQNSRFKLREENKIPSAYSRVVLENLIRCTAAEKGYLTAATYINKSATTNHYHRHSYPHHLPDDQKNTTLVFGHCNVADI